MTDANLVQCDCCGRMVEEDDIAFIRYDAFGNAAGCDTYACRSCRGMDVGPTEAEIARSQARIAAVLGPEEIAKLEKESLG